MMSTARAKIEPGTKFGSYSVLKKVGIGRFCDVYEAYVKVGGAGTAVIVYSPDVAQVENAEAKIIEAQLGLAEQGGIYFSIIEMDAGQPLDGRAIAAFVDGALGFVPEQRMEMEIEPAAPAPAAPRAREKPTIPNRPTGPTLRDRASSRVKKQSEITKSFDKAQESKGVSLGVIAALLCACGLFAAERAGYLEVVLSQLPFNKHQEDVLASVPAKTYQIRPKDKIPERAPAAAQNASLPEFAFGDEFVFRHAAKNGKGALLASDEMRYLVVGAVSDKISWNVAEQMNRVSSRNPFLGELEDYNSSERGNPEPIAYEGNAVDFFPLEIGKKMDLKRVGKPSESYLCEVKGKEDVVVGSAKLETFRVECHTEGSERARLEVYNYSALVGFWVQRSTEVRSAENTRSDQYILTTYKRSPISK